MIIKILCDILKNHTNELIFLLAILEIILGVCSFWCLLRLRHRIRKLNKANMKNIEKARKLGNGNISKDSTYTLERNWDEFDDFLKDYQKQSIIYSTFSLLIQIFTLLGILGTVSGLYIAMYDKQDIYTGVEFALSSTILGIIFAIVFKIVDIVFEAYFINYIEDGIARYESGYNVYNEESRKDFLF